jgi:hypothetical protein
MAGAVPLAAVELCAIDIARNAGTSSGFSVGPGLLFCAGGAAGALSQTLSRLPDAGVRFAPVPTTVLAPTGMSTPATSQNPAIVGVQKPFMQGVGRAYLRSMCAAGANSLVRVGMMSYFAAISISDL